MSNTYDDPGVQQDDLNNWLEGFGANRNRAIDVAKRLVGNREDVTVTFKQGPSIPIRLESRAREHSFASIKSFGEYLAKYGGSNTVILANCDTGVMTATLDETKTDGREIVSMSPPTHPLFKPWLDQVRNADLRRKEVTAIAKFLLQNRHVITMPNPKEAYGIFSQITMSKSIEAHSGIGNGCRNGIIVEHRVRGTTQSGKSPVEIPETIRIACPLFIDTDPISMDVDVLVSFQEDVVYIDLSIPELPIRRLDAIEQMIAALRSYVHTEACIGYGISCYADWHYIKS